MVEPEETDIAAVKNKLRTYKADELSFNEPHFGIQLSMRGGKITEVKNHLLNPDALDQAYTEEGKYGETKHILHFRISNTRTMIIPAIFDPRGRKGLYAITYIMRHRRCLKTEGFV